MTEHLKECVEVEKARIEASESWDKAYMEVKKECQSEEHK